MMTVAEMYGRNLLAIRERAGLSQEGLHMRSGIHRTVISNLERGETGPAIETIVRLAEFFEVPVGDFFAGIGPDPEDR